MNKSLAEYIACLAENDLVVKHSVKDPESIPVRSITYDSKSVSEGTLFVCKGAAFKKEYLEDALSRGAVCYVSETEYEIPGADAVIVRDIRRAMPYIAQLFYAVPEDFHCIGITGTKGKTTTAYYLKAVFDAAMRRWGKPEVGFMTTVETYDGAERIKSGITTPESFEIYRHFRNAYDSGIRHMIMEFSSQALKYRRVQGIRLDAGIFLNVSEDHISPIEHPDFADYFASKLKIFSQCRTAVVCTDSPYAKQIREAAEAAENVVTFGFDESADVYGYDIRLQGSRTAFRVRTKGGTEEFVLNMRGTFNVENALAVIAAAQLFGIPSEAVSEAFASVTVPGRVEEYESADGNLHVIVDYAHNGFSFRNIIGMARENWPDRRIVTVFGTTGGKALNRRKDMGLAAGQNSDFIYLTADDPAKERVEDICADVGRYIDTTGCPYTVIPDREEAIRTAVLQANEPSVILLLGKGCETAQKTANGSEFYASDAVIAKEALKKYNVRREKDEKYSDCSV